MALNPNLTELDLQQAQKRTIDSLDDAVRIILADTTGIAIELSAADGDSVQSLPLVSHHNEAVSSTTPTGELIVRSMTEARQAQLMATITSAITGTCTIELDINPHPSQNNWVPTGITLAVTGSTNIKSTILSDLGFKVRARVVSNTISAGSAEVYLVVRS